MTEDNSNPRAGPRVMYVKRLTLSDACTSKQIKLPRSAVGHDMSTVHGMHEPGKGGHQCCNFNHSCVASVIQAETFIVPMNDREGAQLVSMVLS